MDLLKSIFKGDKVIWIIFLCLCLISIIEVFSAASTLTYKSGDHWGPITQHSIILMVGAVVVVFLHNVPYKWFQVFPVFLYPISLVLLAFVTLMGIITGDRVNGAARWMTFMGLQFQPSELAKMAVIIAVSFILSKRQDEEGANPKAFKYIMILTGLVLLLIAPENLSTAMLLFGVVFMMMFIGRVAAKKLLLLAGGLVLIVALGVGTVVAIPAKTLHNTPGLHRLETWQNRIKGFFDKDEVPAAKFDIDKDAQIAHARIAIATSHVVGKGPGNSIQRDFLSQAFSDFIFAIVIEEMGLIGGIFVVFLPGAPSRQFQRQDLVLELRRAARRTGLHGVSDRHRASGRIHQPDRLERPLLRAGRPDSRGRTGNGPRRAPRQRPGTGIGDAEPHRRAPAEAPDGGR